jgi:2-succinyl-6-hydroxy-2,4-cyclohexadiene-1-carboxylate synthase
LHGFLGSAHDWQNPDEYSDITLEKIASKIDSVLLSQQIDNPVYIGYSMGGRIAMHMPDIIKSSVSGLIIESASPGIEDVFERKARLKKDFLIADKLESMNFEEFLIQWYNQPLFADLKKSQNFKKIFRSRLKNNPVQLARAIRLMSIGKQKSLWKMFHSLDLPVLIISGSNDEKYTSYTKRMSELSSSVRTQIVSGAGHVVNAEKPGEYFDIISQFISSLNR